MKILLKIGIAAALLGYLYWYLDPHAIAQAVTQVDRGALWGGAGMALCGLGIQWVKWQRLLRVKSPTARWVEGLYSLLGGAALGVVTPGRLGEVGRGAFFARDRKAIMALAGIDKLSSALVTLLLGGMAAWLLWPALRGWLLVGAVALGCALWAGWQFGRGRSQLFGQISGWWLIFAWSLAFNLAFMLQFYWLCAGGGVGGMAIMAAVPVVFAIKTLLPIAFMDLGIREAAAVLVFSALNEAAQPAFVASLLVFCFNICLPALAGWLWIGIRATLTGERFALRKEEIAL